jgi:hypothetical protein
VERPTRVLVLAALAVGAGLAAALVLWRGPGAAPPRGPAAAPAPPAAAQAPAAPSAPAAPPPAAALPGEPSDPAELGTDAFGGIDLEEVRAQLPDNLYWQTSAPTQDGRLLREREEEKARWNELYGKVLSGTGTEEEIRAFY